MWKSKLAAVVLVLAVAQQAFAHAGHGIAAEVHGGRAPNVRGHARPAADREPAAPRVDVDRAGPRPAAASGRVLHASESTSPSVAPPETLTVQPASRCTLKSLSLKREVLGNSTAKPFNLNTPLACAAAACARPGAITTYEFKCVYVEQLIMEGHPVFKDVRFSSHYCIDGRHLKNSVHTPGGDISEFLLALNSYQRVVLQGAALTDDQVYGALLAFVDLYAIPHERPFYMHSDEHSDHYFKELLAHNTSIGDRALDHAYTIEGAPAADREAILSMALVPDTLGCGHLKRTLKNPGTYMTSEALTKSVIKAYYRALWRDRDNVNGTGAVEYQILPGDHVEGSVAIVNSGSTCGDSVLSFKPNATFGQVFIYHGDALGHIRQTLTRFLCDRKASLGAASAECKPSALRADMEVVFDAGFKSTAGALAADRPVDTVSFTADGFSGAKTAALTPDDDPSAAAAAAVAHKQTEASGCPILDVTASVAAASKESDPAKLWKILSVEHAKAFLGEAHIVNVVNHTWSCIDGRSHKAILGTPGGTISEFLLALAAFIKKGFTVPNEDTVQALVDLYTERYTIPWVRQFYMHTDDHSVEAMAHELHVDFATLKANLHNPPGYLRPALVAMSATPAFMGCGHVKNTINNPHTYGIDANVTTWAVRSFTRALWADASRGAGRFVLEVLDGDHNEGAVILVKSAGCKGSSAEVAPHQGALAPGSKPAIGDGEAFIFHYADVPTLREFNAKFFANDVRPLTALSAVAYADVVADINGIFAPGLNYTVQKLASTLPMYNDDVSGTKDAEIASKTKTDAEAAKGKLQASKEIFTFSMDLPGRGLPCAVLDGHKLDEIKRNLAGQLAIPAGRVLIPGVRCGLEERKGGSHRTLFQTSRRARRGLRATSVVTDGTWTIFTVSLLPPANADDKVSLDSLARRVANTGKFTTLTLLGFGAAAVHPVVGLDAYPENATALPYGTVSPPSRLALASDADVKSFLATVSAAAGPHPAALDHAKIAKLVAAGKPHFRDVRFAPHYCIDGRHVRGSVHTPGGDISEFLLALSAYQRTVLSGAALSDAQVYDAMTAWIDAFAIPYERPLSFYMHTDEHAEEYLVHKLGKDAAFDAGAPPASEADEKALLEALLDPETQGCGHLKNPDVYGTSADLTKSVIKAFYRALWRDRRAGLGAVDRQVLPGDHAEGSVLVVPQTKEMGDSVLTFAPNVPSVGQVFLFHADALDFIRQSFVRFICDRKTSLGANASAECASSKIRAEMATIFNAGLANTAGRLAANRSTDSLTVAPAGLVGLQLPGSKTVSLELPDDKSAVAKPENGTKCGATDVTAKLVAASKEDDPAKLWKILTSTGQVEAHIGMPAIVDVARHTWSCIDGRSHKAILGTPGGTISEFLLGVASFMNKGLAVPNEDTMQALVDLYTSYYTIPWTRQFYMHTDEHAVEAIAHSLHVDHGEVKPYNPLGKHRPAVLAYSANPKYIGCGHVKYTIQNPAVYGVPANITTWAVRSFMRALWADYQRGAGRFVLEARCSSLFVLEGDHHEGAVILVKPAGCSGKTAEVAPHVGELTPGKNVSNGNTEAFVFHAADVPALRSQNAKFFVETLKPVLKNAPAAIASATLAEVEKDIADIFNPGFLYTAGALASKLPQYQGTVTSGDAAVFTAILQDQASLGNLTSADASSLFSFVLTLTSVNCKSVGPETLEDVRSKLATLLKIRALRIKFRALRCKGDEARRALLQADASVLTINLLAGNLPTDLALGDAVALLRSAASSGSSFLPGYTASAAFPSQPSAVAPSGGAGSPSGSGSGSGSGDSGPNQLAIILPVVLGVAGVAVIAVVVWYCVAMRKANRRSALPKDAPRAGAGGFNSDTVIQMPPPAANASNTAVFDIGPAGQAQPVQKEAGWSASLF
eukprot:tig00000475_g1239.t1